MNKEAVIQREIYKDFPPTDLLEKLSHSHADGCLQVSYNSVTYFVYLAEGKLIYATNSLEPFERLERHLRRLSHEVNTLTKPICTKTRLLFERIWQHQSSSNSDYQAICWLIEQGYIDREQAKKLITRLTNEVLESYLLIPAIKLEILLSKTDKLPIICLLDWQPFVQECRKRLQGWQALSPHIWSSYQRPYFFAQSNAQRKLTSRQQEKLGKILKGFSFRQLSALFDRNELELAKKLHPLIIDGTILLRKPYPPFDRLPKIVNPSAIPQNTINLVNTKDTILQDRSGLPLNENQTKMVLPTISMVLPTISNNVIQEKTWKIACVDDSPAILQKIEQFLENEAFSIFLIQDPIKALIQILKIQHDLILLDIEMPNVDGYQLCSLIRNHSLFKMTPIVMVTGKEGFIDRAKSKLAGATDYVTKPFSQAQLIQIV